MLRTFKPLHQFQDSKQNWSLNIELKLKQEAHKTLRDIPVRLLVVRHPNSKSKIPFEWTCLDHSSTLLISLPPPATTYPGLGRWAPLLTTPLQLQALKTRNTQKSYTYAHTSHTSRKQGGCHRRTHPPQVDKGREEKKRETHTSNRMFLDNISNYGLTWFIPSNENRGVINPQLESKLDWNFLSNDRIQIGKSRFRCIHVGGYKWNDHFLLFLWLV